MERPGLSKHGSFTGRPGAPVASSGASTLAASGYDYTPPYAQFARQHSFYPTAHSPTLINPPLARLFRFDFGWPVFAGDWNASGLIAVSSFNEEPANFVSILRAHTPQAHSFASIATAETPLPITNLKWNPVNSPNLLSSGDALRLWHLDEAGVILEPIATFAKRAVRAPGPGGTGLDMGLGVGGAPAALTPAPLTSFDWPAANPGIAITSSIDTTCTVWDLAAQVVSTQLIAHDREVFDVAFLSGSAQQFVSAGADGSARLFDLRALDNSTIIFEAQPSTPLLRVAVCPTDMNYVAAIAQDRSAVYVLDIRAIHNPVRVLEAHQAPATALKWMPGSRTHLATGGDDCQVLLWDAVQGTLVGAHTEAQQINGLLASPDAAWLGSLSGKSIQGIAI